MTRPALFIGIQLLFSLIFFSCKQEIQQQQIPISVWYGPESTPVNRADLLKVRHAGFTTCVLELHKSHLNEQALAVADSIGLKLVLSDENVEKYLSGQVSTLFAVDSLTRLYRRHRSFEGPLLFKKPGLNDFAKLVTLADYYEGKHAALAPFIQALPNYASPARLDTANYNDYLSLFAQKLNPSVLCAEHFGIMKDGLRDEFFPNLAALRKVSLDQAKPFWAFALAVPFRDHPELVHSHLRLQLYAGLAYGAKGVQYYSFLPPKRSSYEYGDALLNDRGERTQTFWDALAINAEISHLGPQLMQLTSTDVCFSEPSPSGCAGFAPGMPIVKMNAPTMLAGFFKDKHNDSFVLLVNTDINYGKLARITFSRNVESLIEVSKNFMPPEEIFWEKDEIEKEAAILFRAGDGRLFKILKK